MVIFTRKKLLKRISIIMSVMMMLAVGMTTITETSFAASKYRLPTKITYYKYKGGKYVKTETVNIKYTKDGRILSAGSGNLDYGYWKNGKRHWVGDISTLAEYNKKGQLTRIQYAAAREEFSRNSKGYISKAIFTSYPDKRVENLTYTYYSGKKIKTIKSRGKDWDGNFSYTANLSKSGYITRFNNYTYSWTNGKSTSVVVKKSGKIVGKIVFTYNKAPRTVTKNNRRAVLNAAVSSRNTTTSMIDGMTGCRIEGRLALRAWECKFH